MTQITQEWVADFIRRGSQFGFQDINEVYPHPLSAIALIQLAEAAKELREKALGGED